MSEPATHRDDFQRAYLRLCAFRSWQLHKISDTTGRGDMAAGTPRAGSLRFRCKIGKGGYHYGYTMLDAVENAINCTREDIIQQAFEPIA